VAIIRELSESLPDAVKASATVRDLYLWLVGWLSQRPQLIPQLIRKESLEGMFGTTYKKIEGDEARGTYAVGRIFSLLDRWMAGDTLADLERAFGTKEARLGKCEAAREFVLRLLPEISYIFSLPAPIFRAIAIETGQQPNMPLAVDLLGSCVRQGFDVADKVVLRHFLPGRPARRAVHRKFVEIAPVLQAPLADEDFGRALKRVAQAVEISAFL
jgi:hypothetical protein